MSTIAPKAPGWEIFRNALEAFLNEKSPRHENNQAIAVNLMARCGEHFPEEVQDEICALVVRAGVAASDDRDHYAIDQMFTDFLLAQVGREATEQLFDAHFPGAWTIDTCGCGRDECVEIVTTNNKRFRRSLRREQDRAGAEQLIGLPFELLLASMRRRGESEPEPDGTPNPA